MSCLALLVPGFSYGFSLGMLEVESYLGQPFLAKVAIYPSPGENLSDLQVTLKNPDLSSVSSEGQVPQMAHVKTTLSHEGGRYFVRFYSPFSVDEPLFSLSVNFSLGTQTIGHEFIVSLDPQEFSPVRLSQPSSSAGEKSHIVHSESEGNFQNEEPYSAKEGMERWNLDYDSDQVHDEDDDWAALTQDLDSSILAINVDPSRSDDSSSVSYTPKEGETLRELVRRYAYPSVSEIQMMRAVRSANPNLQIDERGYLVSGQLLVIPNRSQISDLADAPLPPTEEAIPSPVGGAKKIKKNYSHTSISSATVSKAKHVAKVKSKLTPKKMKKEMTGTHHKDTGSVSHQKRVKHKNRVRVEPALLSSNVGHESEEDKIARQHRFRDTLKVKDKRIQELQKEVERLEKELGTQKTAAPNAPSEKKDVSSVVPTKTQVTPAIVPAVTPFVDQKAPQTIGEMAERALSEFPTLFFFLIIVLLFVFLAVRVIRSKKKKKNEKLDTSHQKRRESAASSSSRAAQAKVSDINDFEDPVLAPSDTISTQIDDGVFDAAQKQTDDPVAEADLYLQYKHYDDAIHILKDAYDATPKIEYALKLIQVYHQAGNSRGLEAFLETVMAQYPEGSQEHHRVERCLNELSASFSHPKGSASEVSEKSDFLSDGDFVTHSDVTHEDLAISDLDLDLSHLDEEPGEK